MKSFGSKKDGTCRCAMSKETKKVSNVFNVLLNTWDDFWKRTNISGMCNARSSNSGFRRKFWMAIFALFSILTFTGLKDVINDFWSYPVITSVTVKHQNQVK